MLQVLFGEDEHVASDGAYTRLLKSRKWMFVSAFAGIIVIHGLYSSDSFLDLVKIISLPNWLVWNSVLFGLIYLTIQYLIIVLQLLSSYEESLNIRFASKKSEALWDLREKIDTHKREFRKRELLYLKDTESFPLDEEFYVDPDLNKEFQEYLDKNGEINFDKMPSNLLTRIASLKVPGEHVTRFSYEEDRRNYLSELNDMLDRYKALSKGELSEKPLYKYSEIVVDFIRFSTPAIFALWVLYQFYRA